MKKAVLAAGLVAACGGAPATDTPSSALARLGEEFWAEQMHASPVWATFIGDRSREGELDDVSSAAVQRHLDVFAGLAARLETLDRAALAPGEGVTADVLGAELRGALDTARCKTWLWQVDQLSGPQVWLGELPNAHVLTEERSGGGLVARYGQVPRLLRDHVANLRAGLAAGYVAPRINVERVVRQLDEMLAQPPEGSPFAAVPEQAQGAWRAALLPAVRDAVYPALRAYRAFLADEVLPKAREAVGVGSIPDGAACYEALIRAHTGLDGKPEDIHALGLAEVERIGAEMRALLAETGREGDVAAWLAALERDPQQYLATEGALLEHNTALVARAQAALPQVFGRLPQGEVKVKAIEAFRAKDAPAAYYYSAPRDGSRPAYYYVNTFQPETRLLYKMAALAFHEAVPGHHLQIALANENAGLPEFQRHVGQTAFVEGWALYAERLSGELGLYGTAEEKLGALTYEMWRAVRLVVDTGLHAKGWSRDQAVDYLISNTGHRREEAVNEIDRYIIWPGQALAYKMGELEIRRLRDEARQALGDRFDLREFHDRVLRHGAVPLPTLRREIRAWIAAPPG